MSADSELPNLDLDGPGLRRFACVVAWLSRLALGLASALIIIDLLLIGAAVLLRYVFSTALLGSDELVGFSVTALVMLAAPDVLRRNGHIGVDMLVGCLSPRMARWAAAWSCLSVLLVAGGLIVNGWKAVALAHMIGQLTEGQLEIPIWALQLFLPVGGVLLGLVALELLWRVLTVSAQRPAPSTLTGVA
ncbi:TRAP transporter small permease [Castellaniella sp.]|uniref:TRAP transporter small permease n=1 Tax=Castellaniella sp. TaxID=1955812 RepID=UPI002AFF9767|nr:TRAP transporter small permease subunit [Castellaniella sp.]